MIWKSGYSWAADHASRGASGQQATFGIPALGKWRLRVFWDIAVDESVNGTRPLADKSILAAPAPALILFR
jgi:hypothetical protein